MRLWYKGKKGSLLLGDCAAVLKKMPENSIDAVVTDPPYGLSFMGKHWDYDVPSVEIWREVFRVLKPGGHLLSFAGSRTYHRMAVNIEDAGFEIRDQIMWVYGSGFPKSLDISKAIDKAAGAERVVVAQSKNGSGAQPNKLNNHNTGDTGIGYMDGSGKVFDITAPASPEAKQWEGWGTALKPAHEDIVLATKPLAIQADLRPDHNPICLARKPLGEKTVAANVLKYGTGGINIDGCRVGYEDTPNPATNPLYRVKGNYRPAGNDDSGSTNYSLKNGGDPSVANSLGRFPANFIHDGSEEVVSCFPSSKGQQGDIRGSEPSRTGGEGTNCYGEYGRTAFAKRQEDSTSAARFFYCAKTSKAERGEGNTHPTVKPKALISYLIKLVLPSGGIVLDPFSGSGTLAVVCEEEELRWVCIDREEKYCDIAKERLQA